jgi:hypothetical protein
LGYKEEQIREGSHMNRLVGLGKVFAVIGGLAWTVKSGIIIIMNDHFQPVEGVLYFIGVGGIVLGALGFGAFVARRWDGAARWIAFVLALAISIVITAVAVSVVQNVVGDFYSGGNVGIEEEMGIITPGVLWLLIGLVMMMSRSTHEHLQRGG